jgi:hypothetical protein
MTHIEIEIGDDCYEVEVEDFQPPGRLRWNEPPEPGEISITRNVKLFISHGKYVTTAWDIFIRLWAEQCGTDDLVQAERRLEDVAFEMLMQRLEDDYGDP